MLKPSLAHELWFCSICGAPVVGLTIAGRPPECPKCGCPADMDVTGLEWEAEMIRRQTQRAEAGPEVILNGHKLTPEELAKMIHPN